MISRSIRKNRRYTLRENLTGWVFLLPALAGFLFFFLLPIIAGVMFSFSDYTGFNLDSLQFVGLSNYQKMFSDDYFLQALRNNVVYALLFTPLTLILALFFASTLNRVVFGRKFFRICFFLPYISSMVSIAVVWKLIFNPTGGPLNLLLAGIGIAEPPKWLMSSSWALYAVIIISVWKSFGYYMLILLAGMQTIPSYLYEAADQDNFVAQLQRMPQIRRIRYASETAAVLANLSSMITWVGMALILLLVFIAVLLISNTIKLSVFVRRTEIGIMKYIGAKDSFVKIPFVVEGMIIGILGAVLPTVLIYISYGSLVQLVIQQFSSFTQLINFSTNTIILQLIPIFFAVGIVVGILGSVLSLRKYLKV